MRESLHPWLNRRHSNGSGSTQVYSKPEAYLPQLQVALVQGRYEAMWLGFLRGQLDGRYVPLSDHHVRGLSLDRRGRSLLAVVSTALQQEPLGISAV